MSIKRWTLPFVGLPVRCLALIAVVALGSPAFAHGGQYQGPKPSGGGGAVPPGTADRPAPVTSWESWWAANKEFHLQLHERMRETPDITPGNGDGPDVQAALRARRMREDALRRAELLPFFLGALEDDSFEVRTAAAIALGKLGNDEALPGLLHALEKDSHKDVRDSALIAIGMVGAEHTVPRLVDVLSDNKAETRHRGFAAFGLGLTANDDAKEMLLRYARRQGPRLINGAIRPPQLDASVFVALGLTEDKRAVPILEAAIDGRRYDELVKSFAVLALGRLNDRTTMPRLIELLNGREDVNLRRSAAVALGRVAHSADAEAVGSLLQNLKTDIDPSVRHFCAVALGRMADARLKAELLKVFEKGRVADQPMVALALGVARHGGAAPLIRKTLAATRQPSARGAYCIALALMGDTTAAPLIEAQLTQKGDIWLPGYAALSLGMLRNRTSADLIRERLGQTNDPRLKMNLAVALGLLHDPEARRFLTETVEGDSTIYERGSAAMALGVLRMNKAVPVLKRVYENKKEQEMVRAFAVVALGVLVDPSHLPKLSRFSIDSNYTIGIDPLNEVLSIL